MPVNKFIDPVPQAKCELQAKGNMLFSSTAIANGKCTAVVTTIGMQTEVGNIHQDIQAAAEEDSDTPLKRKLNDFGELLAMVCSCHPHDRQTLSNMQRSYLIISPCCEKSAVCRLSSTSVQQCGSSTTRTL